MLFASNAAVRQGGSTFWKQAEHGHLGPSRVSCCSRCCGLLTIPRVVPGWASSLSIVTLPAGHLAVKPGVLVIPSAVTAAGRSRGGERAVRPALGLHIRLHWRLVGTRGEDNGPETEPPWALSTCANSPLLNLQCAGGSSWNHCPQWPPSSPAWHLHCERPRFKGPFPVLTMLGLGVGLDCQR